MAALFEHILVPLDFTSKNSTALDFALELAQQNAARVTLLHVIEEIEYVDESEIASFYETLQKRASANLATCSERFQAVGLVASKEVIVDKRVRGIVDYAIREAADLIVLSSHKVDLATDARSWATLSYQVSILCQCPVMLVK